MYKSEEERIEARAAVRRKYNDKIRGIVAPGPVGPDPVRAALIVLRAARDAYHDAQEAAKLAGRVVRVVDPARAAERAADRAAVDARRAARDRRRELAGLEAAAWDAVKASVLARTEGTGTQAQVLAATVAAKALTEEREALGV